jgi:hypothetical protein
MISARSSRVCPGSTSSKYMKHSSRYETAYGMVLNVDEVKETLRLRTEIGEATIDLSDILSITPDNNRLFDEVPDDPW